MDIIVTALSVVFSGVVATVITILYQKFSGEQTAKRKVFETAVSYRFFISEEENVKSLNSIDVVFHKNQKVRQAWKSYMDEADKPSSNPQQLNDRYIKLLEEMALACGYKDIRWDDLKRYYYPSGLLNRKNDDEVLKKLQIKAAEKTASDTVDQQNTPPNEQFANQMMLQLLPKLIENPDNFYHPDHDGTRANNKFYSSFALARKCALISSGVNQPSVSPERRPFASSFIRRMVACAFS